MNSNLENLNYHPSEIEKFDSKSARWWDPNSEFKPLHDINPIRLDYIKANCNIVDKQILDVGCGGGILSESMAKSGGDVTGIDLGDSTLEVAKLHCLESGVSVNYQYISAEQLAEQQPSSFDIVTCMEMLEHVPDPASVVAACAKLVKPGGRIFLSTINRNPKSYLLAIIGAEYLLKMLAKGTHDYSHFIRPSELDQWARLCGLNLLDLSGMQYNPMSRNYSLCNDVSVNYLAHYIRPNT